MKFDKYYLPAFISVLFFLGCARQTAPTGGPKDTIPPVLIKAIPKQGQTSYTTPSLELTFDETLLLNNPREQIIIIPNIGKEFEATTKKNKLQITFNDPLTENTTYSINFREAVQDITEKNPVENLKLAFSTGTYIDSLSISGTVAELLTAKISKDATVALYQSDTFDIFKHKPSYFSKTDEKGRFVIDNLKPGTYYIYAIQDRNKNLVADSKSESYGFITSPILLTHDTTNIHIQLYQLDTRPLKLTSARPSSTYFNVKTSKFLATYQIKAQQPVVSSYGETHDNILIYNTFNEIDSLQIHLKAYDSLLQSIDTILYAKFTQRQLTPEPFKATVENFRVIGQKGTITGQIQFTKPIKNINYDSIFYQIDSLTIIKITAQDLLLDTLSNLVTINTNFDKTLLSPPSTTTQTTPDPPRTQQAVTNALTRKTSTANQKTNHQLYIASKTFISIESDTSTAIRQSIKPTTLETTGTIIVDVNTKQPNYIIQLLSKDFNIIQSIANTPRATFEDLEPTTYQLRLVIDQNEDNFWSPGNFYNGQEPEPIIFYKNEKHETPITLKPNWELGPLLITY